MTRARAAGLWCRRRQAGGRARRAHPPPHPHGPPQPLQKGPRAQENCARTAWCARSRAVAGGGPSGAKAWGVRSGRTAQSGAPLRPRQRRRRRWWRRRQPAAERVGDDAGRAPSRARCGNRQTRAAVGGGWVVGCGVGGGTGGWLLVSADAATTSAGRGWGRAPAGGHVHGQRGMPVGRLRGMGTLSGGRIATSGGPCGGYSLCEHSGQGQATGALRSSRRLSAARAVGGSFSVFPRVAQRCNRAPNHAVEDCERGLSRCVAPSGLAKGGAPPRRRVPNVTRPQGSIGRQPNTLCPHRQQLPTRSSRPKSRANAAVVADSGRDRIAATRARILSMNNTNVVVVIGHWNKY